MNPECYHPLFSTITGEDWRVGLQRARERRKKRKGELGAFIASATAQLFLDDPHKPEDAAAIAARWIAEDKAKREGITAQVLEDAKQTLLDPAQPAIQAARFLGFDIAHSPDKTEAFVVPTSLVRRTFTFEDIDMDLMGEVILGEAKGWSKQMVDAAEREAIRTVMGCLKSEWDATAAPPLPDLTADYVLQLAVKARRSRPIVGALAHPATIRAIIRHFAGEEMAEDVIVPFFTVHGIDFEPDASLPTSGEGAVELYYDLELFQLRKKLIGARDNPAHPPA